MFNKFFKSKKEEKKITKILSQYGDKHIFENNTLQAKPSNKNITIVVTNIRNYYALSQKIDFLTLMNVINEYYSIVTKIITKYEGTVDNLIGDKVLSLFGTPIESKDFSKKAICASLEIKNCLHKFNMEKNNFNDFPFDVTIGINTGQSLVGNFGSQQRMSYTAIGDSVNAAFRISKIGKESKIYISRSTFEDAESYIKDNKKISYTPVEFKQEQFFELDWS